MKVGDLVWVGVTRDKDRAGVITNIGYEGNTDVRLESGITIPVLTSRLRSMSEGLHPGSVIDLEAKKNDQEKTRLELIPVSGLEGIGRAMTFGAKKYSAHNWANGFDWLRLIGSCLRHLAAWSGGEDKDPESGLSHLDHAGACIVMLIAHETEGLGNDNRRKIKKESN